MAGVRKRESFVCKVGKQGRDLEVDKNARGRLGNKEESKREIWKWRRKQERYLY